MSNNKSLNTIAKFFNTYEIIDFDDSKKYEEQKKIMDLFSSPKIFFYSYHLQENKIHLKF